MSGTFIFCSDREQAALEIMQQAAATITAVRTAFLIKGHAPISRLLKNTHLLRCAHPSSLRRTAKYASFLIISRALHLNVFDQPVKNHFFNNLLVPAVVCVFQ
jgi:hypothetical protein